MTEDQSLQELPDSELFAYLENEASPDVVQIIENSEYYKKRVYDLSVEQMLLQKAVFRQDCPDSMELGEYYLGQLKDIEAENISQHLDTCPHCIHDLAIFNDFLQADIPKASILDRFKIFVGRLTLEIENSDFLDPRNMQLNQQSAMSVRGNKNTNFPVIYNGDNDIQILLDIGSPKNRLKKLVGFVKGAPQENIRVDLWLEDSFFGSYAIESNQESNADKGWNFTIPDLKEGTYELIIKGPHLLIHIQSFII